MRQRQLDRVLRNIVSVTLATTSACVVGCGSDEKAAPLGQGMTPACPVSPLFSGFRPAPLVDYIAARTEFLPETPPTTDGGASDGWTATVGEAYGTPCSASANVTGCKQRLAELRIASLTACPTSGDGFGLPVGTGGSSGAGRGAMQAGCSVSYLVYTRGDEIGVARTREEIVALLGPIDTKEEALYLVSRDGVTLNCYQDPKAAYTATPGGGFDVLGETPSGCTYEPIQVDQLIVHIAPDGTRSITSRSALRQTQGGCAEGRRPAGLASNGGSGEDLGKYFARAAHLEAASVVAFEQLETELASHGAPQRLLASMRRARREEIAHARATTKLALRFGGEPAKVRVNKHAPRSLLALAIDNAREGCVRETLGAAVALYRAERAEDPEVAAAYRVIAEDELRHARISWDLAAWLETKLTASQKARVRRAFERERASLRAELGGDPSPEVARVAGAPSALAMQGLFARLEAEVWAPALAA
jgi:hypothetical protein